MSEGAHRLESARASLLDELASLQVFEGHSGYLPIDSGFSLIYSGYSPIEDKRLHISISTGGCRDAAAKTLDCSRIFIVKLASRLPRNRRKLPLMD